MTEIFVFGSNLSGIHGAGAAKYAMDNLCAVYGVGAGMTGLSYAIPTKDCNIQTMYLHEIEFHVCIFKQFAAEHPEYEFKVSKIGCGLAGYRNEDIAPMFKNSPYNCTFDTEWAPWLEDGVRFWGTM